MPTLSNEYEGVAVAAIDHASSQARTVNADASKIGGKRDVQHKCEVCGRGFSMSGHLTRHMRMHTGERPHMCSFTGCGKAYSRKDNLRNHELSAHMRDQWEHQCDRSGCEREFPTAEKLKRHIALHDRPRPFECDDCGKSFRKKRQLAMHRTEHTGKLPYPCTEEGCEKEFPSPSALRKHLLVHSWGEERYVCLEETCVGNESFEKFSQLQKHIKAMHTKGYRECAECNRRFRTSSLLSKHKKTHEALVTDRKLFACDHAGCMGAFTTKSNLSSHIRSKHTEPDSFICTVCERTFSYLVVLQRHMRSVHKMNPAALADRKAKKRRRPCVPEPPRRCDIDKLTLPSTDRYDESTVGAVDMLTTADMNLVSHPTPKEGDCTNKRHSDSEVGGLRLRKRPRCLSPDDIQRSILSELNSFEEDGLALIRS